MAGPSGGPGGTTRGRHHASTSCTTARQSHAPPLMSHTLEALVRKHPEIAPAAHTLRVLATTLPDITLPAGVPHMAAAEARLATGIPALEGEPLLTGSALMANISLLVRALGEVLESSETLPEALEHRVGGSAVDSLAAAALTGAWDFVAETARRAALDPHLVITIVDHAARPALRAGASALNDLLVQSRWTRATCPGCGAPPLLAELRSGSSVGGAEQERVLRCGRCLAAWAFPRLCCTGCGETSHQQLAYLHASGEGTFRRADVCSTCGTYLKSIAVLTPLTLPELLDLDLATAALDVAAVEQGLHR
jgi:FdhE protein